MSLTPMLTHDELTDAMEEIWRQAMSKPSQEPIIIFNREYEEIYNGYLERQKQQDRLFSPQGLRDLFVGLK